MQCNKMANFVSLNLFVFPLKPVSSLCQHLIVSTHQEIARESVCVCVFGTNVVNVCVCVLVREGVHANVCVFIFFRSLQSLSVC